MGKAMETVQDLVQEAKLRTVWWGICIFAVSYFLSHTSKSMWTNIPIAVLLLSVFRILSQEVELRWKARPIRKSTILSHLEKKQLSVDDPLLSTAPISLEWKRDIGSPLVESAVNDFLDKVLQDFVVELWYSEITPDREAPELMRLLINDVLGEISARVKEINLVDLLTRDMVELIGNHLDLFRKKQSSIGIEVMGTLSSEERDERLKHHLIASKELHPALLSPECEYKVLQRLMGALLAVVLRPRESQCPLVRCIARELLTCLVMQPIMNLASPAYINELIEYILLNAKEARSQEAGDDQSPTASSRCSDHPGGTGGAQTKETVSRKRTANSSEQQDLTLAKVSNEGEANLTSSRHGHGNSVPPRPADWARVLEAATQRRSEVLAPENLENMWTRGRNYKNKVNKRVKAVPPSVKNDFGAHNTVHNTKNEMLIGSGDLISGEDKVVVGLTHRSSLDAQASYRINAEKDSYQNLNEGHPLEGASQSDILDSQQIFTASGNKTHLKRSSSTSALKSLPDGEKKFSVEGGRSLFSEEFYSPNFNGHKLEPKIGTRLDIICHGDGPSQVPKLKCRRTTVIGIVMYPVVGAYFEKSGSNSFAVYSIAVTDAEGKTWFVKRRYRNFERLHRYLKDIPNYTLHLPPKRFLSSSVDDSFVHQRCIQLDRYLQDLLSIANVAEQHEVWDFLSMSSKNYSFGKSPSVMKTLAVNVDDAMDDILRQFKGVSGGLMRKVVGSSPVDHPVPGRIWSSNSDEMNKQSSSYNDLETSNSMSDNDVNDLDVSHDNEEVNSHVEVSGWHSDNELNSKGFPPRVIKLDNQSKVLNSGRSQHQDLTKKSAGANEYPVAIASGGSELAEDPVGMPPEIFNLVTSILDVPPDSMVSAQWTPPNVSVPLLNLVDKMFQLNRRGWLRRQVFWISKQILQLMMEDAIDDWLLRQIHWLRRDDIVAFGIRWVQDVLWPNGKFFLDIGSARGKMDVLGFSTTGNHQPSKTGSFELQLEAARRASDVKKMLLGGAPTTLVSLIGHKQYKRCARDLYYFLQSNTCIKQLAYGILELSLVSIFPELREVILDVHEKHWAQAQPI
ncbi:hypothetical protein Syun_015539 [Stephania yunnanensis]|uniref:Uncharacterized protein n=1 Tax=Stephania yunnanensis TaxID=152371 RepID=A0AAP0PAM4_9MAGN